ncbi:hypothetical protein O3P69_002110 [Scylla paramamosain]|uniref:Uncharacterized protein n=1 Tax=Scylla paramamosain TaxID=85552 RepID=A0AAW0V802_SCYPA
MLLRSVVFISFLIAQGMRECDGGPARCHTSFLSGELVRATVQVASTTPLKGFYVVFQSAPDECLLSALEASGLGARLLSSAGSWKSTLESVPYGTASQHLLIGNLTWIADMVSQASLMMAAHTLHTEMTSWVWVVTLPTNTIQPDSSGCTRASLQSYLRERDSGGEHPC